MKQNNGKATVSMVLAIIGLVLAVFGGITFGVIGAGIALVFCIVALVLSITVKKKTNNAKGQPGFICGLIGAALAAVFMVGCVICGMAEMSSKKTNYSCYGSIGGSYMSLMHTKHLNDAARKRDRERLRQEVLDELLEDLY